MTPCLIVAIIIRAESDLAPLEVNLGRVLTNSMSRRVKREFFKK